MSTDKNRLPYMPFFVADYLSKTRRMTLAERGAYTDLLFQQWVGGPLPSDPDELALLIACKPRDFAKVWPAIKDKFTATAAGLVNRTLEKHRRKAIKVLEGRRDGARKTNLKRWGDSHNESLSESDSESLSDGNGSLSESHPIQSNLSDAYQGERGN